MLTVMDKGSWFLQGFYFNKCNPEIIVMQAAIVVPLIVGDRCNTQRMIAISNSQSSYFVHLMGRAIASAGL